jgi:hypothetical protein
MTLVQCLKEAGFLLSQDVNLMVQELTDGDQWSASGLITGRVQEDIPQAALGRKELADYDPEHNLLVRWKKDGKWMLYKLNRTGNNPVKWDEKAGGLIIESADQRARICISQTLHRDNPEQTFWFTLKNRLRGFV